MAVLCGNFKQLKCYKSPRLAMPFHPCYRGEVCWFNPAPLAPSANILLPSDGGGQVGVAGTGERKRNA